MWSGISLRSSSSSSAQFWNDGNKNGWAINTAVVLVLILICQFASKVRFPFRFRSRRRAIITPVAVSSSPSSHHSISDFISDLDLKILIDNLDGKIQDDDKWENVIDRSNNTLSYNAKSCKPKDGPLKYLSTTIFENCTPEILKDFYLDNDYRKKWDKTLTGHDQLQVDESNGIEIGCTIKKFPLLTPREYVLAWRVWEGKERTFYCFSKECEHPMAPNQKKYVRVRFFRSGWRIRKVPGRNACEIKMLHQEDASLNVEMAKLAFAKGIWSYVCKMDYALRKYSAISTPQLNPSVTAVTLIQKVPPELDTKEDMHSLADRETVAAAESTSQIAHERSGGRKLSRKPSKKLMANGLILLGGIICISRGHSDLGAKVAMAYIVSKFTKRGASSQQNRQA